MATSAGRPTKRDTTHGDGYEAGRLMRPTVGPIRIVTLTAAEVGD